jgi:hypothetical protein
MENNQKPEWFELAENDQPVSRPLKSKKSAPMRNLTFILAGILVIPMGAGFALLTHEDHSAVAAETLNLTQDSPVATNSGPAEQSNTIAMPTASRDEDDDEGDDDDDDEDDDDHQKSHGKKSKDSDDHDEDDEEDDD